MRKNHHYRNNINNTIVNNSITLSQKHFKKIEEANGAGNTSNLNQIHKLKLIELSHIKLFKSFEHKRYKYNQKRNLQIS